jgi:hypothetical protein
MAVEQGLIMLLQANAAVAAISTGGWEAELPPDATLPNWSWITIYKHPQYALQAMPGLVPWAVQIDSYSASDQGADSQSANSVGTIPLAQAIYNCLSGYQGTLPDPQNTQVDSIFLEDEELYFDSVRRTWRIRQDYRVNFYLQAGIGT